MTAKPLLLLDFDGVVNFFASRSSYGKQDSFGYLKRNAYRGYNINWSSELVNKLNAAKAKHDFEWLWLSTWKDLTQLWVDPTLHTHSDGFVEWDADSGFTEKTRSFEVEDTRNKRKYAKVLELLAENPRPFVWVDDSAVVEYNSADFVGKLNVPHLAVNPDPNYGVLKGDLTAMLNFWDSLSS